MSGLNEQYGEEEMLRDGTRPKVNELGDPRERRDRGFVNGDVRCDAEYDGNGRPGRRLRVSRLGLRAARVRLLLGHPVIVMPGVLTIILAGAAARLARFCTALPTGALRPRGLGERQHAKERKQLLGERMHCP